MEGRAVDLVVVGGGPAGLSAAVRARRLGLSVLVLDERTSLGGQVFKQPGEGLRVTDHAALGAEHLRGYRLVRAAQDSGAEMRTRADVVSVGTGRVDVVHEGRLRRVDARTVLLAPGAHDRPVAFPGWTLPGVMTAGAAQTLVKSQRISPGRRLVFAGSGPLALAFPAQLAGYGLEVATVLEAGPAPRPTDLAGLLRAAPGNVPVLRDAARYRGRLLAGRVPLRYRRIVVRAEGDDRVEQVVHARVDEHWRVVPGTEETVAADTLCLGYGFVPSVELHRVAGCRLEWDELGSAHVPARDALMRSSVDGALVAGDGAGVAGHRAAAAEGELAAVAAALDLGRITPSRAQEEAAGPRRVVARTRALTDATARMYRVGPGLDELADDATTVCRCEEVTAGRVRDAVAGTADLNVVKGLTRAGMGLCQGRMCTRQLAAAVSHRHGVPLGDVLPMTPRSPVRPVDVSAVADDDVRDAGFFRAGA